jgi:hypothetical protein
MLVQAKGVEPGTFSYKLHDTVPLLETNGSPAEFARVLEPLTLFDAPPIDQAGAHADLSVTSVFTVSSFEAVFDKTDVPWEVIVNLPPGVMANLGTVPECKLGAFENTVYGNNAQRCDAASQVGVVSALFGGVLPDRTYPLYKIYTFPGHLAAFGFAYELISERVPVVLTADLRTHGDYGITLARRTPGVPYFVPAPFITFWGVPGDPIHDSERWNPEKQEWGVSIDEPHMPLIANSSDCTSGVLEAKLTMQYWFEPEHWLPDDPEDFAYRSFTPEPTGCESLTFTPQFDLSLSTSDPDSSSGITEQIRLPRSPESNLETPALKEATVSLPEGMSINPATANGLMGCTSQQIGLEETDASVPNRFQFAPGNVHCPDASKIGTLVAKTPLVEEPVKGAIYFATPFENPFHSFLALYLVFEGPGLSIRLAAKVDADPQTGQLTATIGSLPQLPLEELSLNLFDGPRAPLSTPRTCGKTVVRSRFVPWSAPQSGPPASLESPLIFDSTPDGTPCPGRVKSPPFAPRLDAGSKDPIAAATSPFILNVSRAVGDQDLKSIAVKLPRGLVASVPSVGSYCTDAEVARAEARNRLGEGALERGNPSCPPGSQVGSLLVDVGTGSIPLFVKGDVYLAGPYKGAPLSLVAITPAIGGGTEWRPVFDLGVITVRTALDIDPRTGQISVRTDAIPRILDGIPLRIRDIRILMNLPGLIRNSTSCEEMKVEAGIEGWDGGKADLANRFQLGGCQNLKFQPRLSVHLVGSRLGQRPRLRAVLRGKPGNTGISRATIILPRSESLIRSRVGRACSRPRLLRHSCPRRSVYGHVVAWSPLVKGSLKGPVYLTSTAHGLPVLVLSLNGQFSLEMEAKIRMAMRRVHVTFAGVPDVPFSKLVMSLRGARKGFLVNTRNLCNRRIFVAGRFTARDGRVKSQRAILTSSCENQKRRYRRAFAR